MKKLSKEWEAGRDFGKALERNRILFGYAECKRRFPNKKFTDEDWLLLVKEGAFSLPVAPLTKKTIFPYRLPHKRKTNPL